MYTLLQNSLVFLRSKIVSSAQVVFNQFDLMDVIIVFNWVHALLRLLTNKLLLEICFRTLDDWFWHDSYKSLVICGLFY